MKRPTPKEIKEAVEKLKYKPPTQAGPPNTNTNKLSSKKTNQRIRKQGI